AGPFRSYVPLRRPAPIDITCLAIATIYSLTLPLKRTLALFDAAVLITLFVLYAIRISRAPAEEPHLVGPARLIGDLPTARRRTVVIVMLLAAAGVILASAEPFAQSLVDTGEQFGIDTFLLVQWVAPLASEAPELLVAGLFAWRLNTNAGLGTLVSAKVNQWTLLVGTLPIVFALGLGGLHGLPIDPHQREELFLTAAQSFFALSLLVTLSISTTEALVLFALFWAQFVIRALVPESFARLDLYGVGFAYVGLRALSS